ncbi:MAG TPA: hypothetical protein PLN56_04185 [Methanoregulaceae archaeon]|nr:hypothetical protein [Methanoregulaceae archaeon]
MNAARWEQGAGRFPVPHGMTEIQDTPDQPGPGCWNRRPLVENGNGAGAVLPPGEKEGTGREERI